HFSTQETEASFLVPGRPRLHDLHEFLAELAVIKPATSGNPMAATDDVLRTDALNNSDDYKIVVTARRRGTIPVALWNSSYFVFVGEKESLASATR
ncbi:MAG TPA: hypothetical protein VKB60_04050, partial [Terriglobales bacterium]|nr:hypothetical protein [Terriglobales bacterium]